MAPQLYVGLLLTTLATLMYEVLLPRVLSVTMVYHFAFMAVSLAMFGMTVGAVIVHLRPSRYTEARARDDLALNAAAHAATLVASFALYLQIPFFDSVDAKAVVAIVVTYAVLAVPFVFSGITVALALTRFPRHVASLYAADLVGAAIGCFAVLVALDHTDAPTAVLVVATVAALGAVAFAWRSPRVAVSRGTAGLGLLLALSVVGHHALVQAKHPILRLVHRTLPTMPRDYERWNAHSYVEVFPKGDATSSSLGWGMSRKTPQDLKVPLRAIAIDEKAGTGMVGFQGDTKSVDFLRYDVTNAAHQIRKSADVCVIGVGGGRDVLSALYFDQRSVLGIELNDTVLGLLTDRYADFSGHLDRDPRVTLARDEARSYLARTDRRFDILQISLIDTFAATAAGAFALAENSLYTVDAWDVFLRRLKPHGVLTVSRYYFHHRPAEAYRMLGLAVAALERQGISEPRSRLVLLKNQTAVLAGDAGIGTLLVSPDPFSKADLDALSRYARQMDFEIVLSPSHASNQDLETIADGKGLREFYEKYPIDISPIDDDRPFFFQMLRLRDVVNQAVWDERDVNWKNLRALLTLFTLLAVVVVLTVLCVVVPLRLAASKTSLKRSGPLLGYFGAIGFGFMFVEMAEMQRLTIFLGHPSYALSVVLFTLLLASGAGSYVAGKFVDRLPSRALAAVPLALIAIVWLAGAATPFVTRHFAGAPTQVRIAAAVALLACMGFPMGMPFPLGMRRAAARADAPLPWLWGMNGAASVCSSVIATILGLSFGVTVTFWAGLLSYAVAAAIFALGTERADGVPEPLARGLAANADGAAEPSPP